MPSTWRGLPADMELARPLVLAHMDPVGDAARLMPGEGWRSGVLWAG